MPVVNRRFVSLKHFSKVIALLQEPRRAGVRGVAEPAALHGGRPAAVHPDPGPVARPVQALPALPGPHELGGARGEGRHRRVPVPVQEQAVELLDSRGLYRVRPGSSNRCVSLLFFESLFKQFNDFPIACL